MVGVGAGAAPHGAVGRKKSVSVVLSASRWRIDSWVGGEAGVTDIGLPRKRRPIQAEDRREFAGRARERADPH